MNWQNWIQILQNSSEYPNYWSSLQSPSLKKIDDIVDLEISYRLPNLKINNTHILLFLIQLFRKKTFCIIVPIGTMKSFVYSNLYNKLLRSDLRFLCLCFTVSKVIWNKICKGKGVVSIYGYPFHWKISNND